MSDTPCSQDPEAWFSDLPVSVRMAKARCFQLCPVQVVCLELAMRLEGETRAPSGRYGVWGGLDAKQRARLGRTRRTQERQAQAQAV